MHAQFVQKSSIKISSTFDQNPDFFKPQRSDANAANSLFMKWKLEVETIG